MTTLKVLQCSDMTTTLTISMRQQYCRALHGKSDINNVSFVWEDDRSWCQAEGLIYLSWDQDELDLGNKGCYFPDLSKLCPVLVSFYYKLLSLQPPLV